ncbi:MAG: hypothetical protein L3J37_01100 [Rhodobacteraceae bacterium]|nr:hypothetical protein [Paracoccaceae bacterium]
MKIHQHFITLFTALGLALLVGASYFIWSAPDIWMRMGFAAALYLLSNDVLAGAAIGRGEKRLSNPARWLSAYYLALYFGTFMMLFTWRGLEGHLTLLPGIILGALIYGLMLALLFEGKDYRYAHHFQTEKPWRYGRITHYAWPFISLAGIYLLAYGGLTGALTTEKLFFYLILLGFFLPRYPRVSKGNPLWDNFPRFIGLALLLIIISTAQFSP